MLCGAFAEDCPIIRQRFAGFEVGAHLRTEPESSIFRAKSLETGEEGHALRVLAPSLWTRPAAVQLFYEAARRASMASGPNIYSILDYGREPNGAIWVIQEWAAGESLRVRLERRKKPFDLVQALDLAIQMSAALVALYEVGLVHGRVAPSAFMNLGGIRDQWLKLAHFGCGVLDAAAARRHQHSLRAPTFKGRLDHIDFFPPQGSEDKPTVAVDVFGVGLILYQMLTGSRSTPKRGAPGRRAYRDLAPAVQMNGALAPHKSLLRLLRQCVSKRQGDRFENALDFHLALERVKREVVAMTPSQSRVSAERRVRRVRQPGESSQRKASSRGNSSSSMIHARSSPSSPRVHERKRARLSAASVKDLSSQPLGPALVGLATRFEQVQQEQREHSPTFRIADIGTPPTRADTH